MINVCIVGFGAVGPVHAIALKNIDGVNIYAICDNKKEVADKAASEYGCKAFYDYDECLKDEVIDSVHICTPHYLHFEMITKALEAGKRVVCEKPIVMKKEELDVLFENYDTSKVFPIIQNRTNPSIVKLKELTGDNDYGCLKAVKGIVTWSRDEKYYNSADWRGTLKYEGGGVLINQAVHTLDLMVYLAGKIKSVSSAMSNHSLKGIIDVEDTVNSYIEFENGAKGIFFATNAYPVNSGVQLELEFENKRFLYYDGALFCEGEIIQADSDKTVGKIYWGNGHARTLKDYYENNSTLCVDDIKDTMHAMFAIYESAKSGETIEL